MPNKPNMQIWAKKIPQAQLDHFHILSLQLSFELSYISSLPLLTAETTKFLKSYGLRDYLNVH
jgi:hypothetical protein